MEIVGTDIARDQLARAREGVYSQFEVQRGLPVQMLMRYFRKKTPTGELPKRSAVWHNSASITCFRISVR